MDGLELYIYILYICIYIHISTSMGQKAMRYMVPQKKHMAPEAGSSEGSKYYGSSSVKN